MIIQASYVMSLTHGMKKGITEILINRAGMVCGGSKSGLEDSMRPKFK